MKQSDKRSMPHFDIYLANPRGFCAGVDRAVETVRQALRLYGPPVYVRHAIVHNRTVVGELEREGAILVEHIDDIPNGATAILSAHGVAPAVRKQAELRKLNIIDATCPLVSRVHKKAGDHVRSGYTVLLIGHRSHVEVEGTRGVAPGHILLVENNEDAERVKVPDPQRVAVVTQTTLSVRDTAGIQEILRRRFPYLLIPPVDDICYATQNRQDAVVELCKKVSIMLIIGSFESSNSQRLREVAEKEGCPAYLIDNAGSLQPDWFSNVETVGISSGASTPEVLVTEVLEALMNMGGRSIVECDGVKEEIRFKLPRELQ